MKRIVLAALAGLLYTLAFPTYNLWPAIWIFAVPLLFAIDGASPWEAFCYGMIAGLIAWGGTIYWLGYVMHIYGSLPLAVSALALLLLMTFLALYFGIFAVVAARSLHSRFAFLTLPGVWVLLELVRSYLFTGFPWALLGYSQFPVTPLIQLAEIGGVYLISGVIMMANLALYQCSRKEYKPVIVTGIVLVLCLAWGQWRLQTIDLDGRPLRVGIAQANIPQDQKWLEGMVGPTIDIYTRLTRKALAQGAEIVTWPETACNFYLFLQWIPTARIVGLSRETNADLLIGSPAVEVDQGDRYYNRIWLVNNGLIKGQYDKVHLVPFGEYVPLAWLLQPFIGKLTEGVSDFSKPRGKAVPIEDIGVLICFESLFPDMARDLCRDGAAYLVNASNDAWYKTWSAPEQLLKMSAFRSIETRRYLVRPVNHGISAVIDPMGRIIKSIGLLQEDAIVADIRKLSIQTFYTRFGPILAWLWGLAASAALIAARQRSKKAKRSSRRDGV